MRSLYQICLAYVSNNLPRLWCGVETLPPDCIDWLLEWIVAHDHLNNAQSQLLLSSFSLQRLSRVNFFLSDEVTDELLALIGGATHRLVSISVVHCAAVTDWGVQRLTERQSLLRHLELRGLKSLTTAAVGRVRSPHLTCVDLSDCPLVSSRGLLQFLGANAAVQRILLNHCTAIDDSAVYAIAGCVGARLQCLELDFLAAVADPCGVVERLLQLCPNLRQLSLCRYFMLSESALQRQRCAVAGDALRELDLYGNFFDVLPSLPDSLVVLRLSCEGGENVAQLCRRLRALPNLSSLRLVLSCRDAEDAAVDRANRFLGAALPSVGRLLVQLQVQAYALADDTVRALVDHCPRLGQLSLDVKRMNTALLQQLFVLKSDRAARLCSLKLSRLRATYRTLFAIARHCTNLKELEMSHMASVDDRFMRLLAQHCPRLQRVNLNGCRWVTDKGLCAVARACSLREVRVRSTGVTDACVYTLAQFCPDLEWVSHADYTGKPKFSLEALQVLRSTCVQRVIC